MRKIVKRCRDLKTRLQLYLAYPSDLKSDINTAWCDMKSSFIGKNKNKPASASQRESLKVRFEDKATAWSSKLRRATSKVRTWRRKKVRPAAADPESVDQAPSEYSDL